MLSDSQNQSTTKIPIVAIVGRPNVGKSTLFNRLSKKWLSIVEDRPGITRDRLYAECQIGGNDLILMDTGGLQIDPETKVEKKMSDQAFKGIEEADLILFLFDGRDGVTPLDAEWVRRIRKIKKPKIFVVNKLDEPRLDQKAQEFHELGISPLIPISGETQRNFSGLYDSILSALKLKNELGSNDESFNLQPLTFNYFRAPTPPIFPSCL